MWCTRFESARKISNSKHIFSDCLNQEENYWNPEKSEIKGRKMLEQCIVTKFFYLCSDHVLHSVSLDTCYQLFIVYCTQKFCPPYRGKFSQWGKNFCPLYTGVFRVSALNRYFYEDLTRKWPGPIFFSL